MKCTRCLRKAYCSRDCQLRDWKEGGHKKSCRPPKDFKSLDLIRVMNVGPELNGQLMEVVGPLDLADKIWAVNIIGAGEEDESLPLHEDEMHLVVPVEERVDL